MLTYDFAKAQGPLYEYIYQCIKDDIMEGNLRQGEKLPSKRSFAKNNGISTITIQNAYDQLISEGYIYTIPQKGYYVAKLEGMKKVQRESSISLNISIPEGRPSYKVDLSDNRMNPALFPFSIWAKVLRGIISDKSGELMEASPAGGIGELRTAIAEHLKSFRGMLVDPDQIVIGAGTEYLYGLLVQLLGNEKQYCVENPGYRKIVQVYRQYHISCKYADLDEMGMTFEGLRAARADIAHISPNHHFPTGITMPAGRRYEILAWANERVGRYIIEDDYDSEFRLNGKPIPPLFSMDACEKVIYMNTFSKSLTPTIRISYMVLPVHLINRFYRELSFYACTVSNFEQYTLAAFIRKGYFEKHINRMRLYYSRQRKKMIETIRKSRLHDVCEIMENDSGLHFLIRIKTDKEDGEILRALRERGIRVNALSEYFFTPSDRKHCFIINYSNIDTEKAGEACDIFYEMLTE
ncbi:MAG: PLP-dependent aminotransferase family protein [Lachnospiraceae bacterium]